MLAARFAVRKPLGTCSWQSRREADARSQISWQSQTPAGRHAETCGVSLESHVQRGSRYRCALIVSTASIHRRIVKEPLLLSAGSSAKSSRYRFSFARTITFTWGSMAIRFGCQNSLDQDSRAVISLTAKGLVHDFFGRWIRPTVEVLLWVKDQITLCWMAAVVLELQYGLNRPCFRFKCSCFWTLEFPDQI
jgi:hypothetical protein